MKHALIITTVSGFVPQFEMNNVQILQELGYYVHYASNFHNPHYGSDNRRLKGSGIILHQVDFVRSPFCIRKNISAYRQLLKLLEEIPFDLVHCHTPMGGVLGRLAVKKTLKRKPINVIYTAHGFHFFRGAPIQNWIFYYPIERWLAHDTDLLITINEEDYQRAKKFHLKESRKKQRQIWKVNGVGIEIESYRDLFLEQKKNRTAFGIPEEAYILLSIGELSKRKNHQIVIRALALMKEECRRKKIYYLICGEGTERKKLLRLIRKKNLEDIVVLLGYRTDVKKLLSISDSFIFPSKQEGLPVALMEALAAGLPCVCSNVRGNIDLINGENIILFQKNSVRQCKKAILRVLKEKRAEKRSSCKAQCDRTQVRTVMRKIYQQIEENYG